MIEMIKAGQVVRYQAKSEVFGLAWFDSMTEAIIFLQTGRIGNWEPLHGKDDC